jgi:hypothetical protein
MNRQLLLISFDNKLSASSFVRHKEGQRLVLRGEQPGGLKQTIRRSV